MSDPHLQKLTAAVAASVFANRNVRPDEIAGTVAAIAQSLQAVSTVQPAPSTETAAPPGKTRAEIRKSIRPDALISFEDGRSYRTLTRHLSRLGLTPEAYREKHGLPADYPMSCEALRETRSSAAKARGFGKRPEPEPAPAKPKRAKKPKTADPASDGAESGQEHAPRTTPYPPDF